MKDNNLIFKANSPAINVLVDTLLFTLKFKFGIQRFKLGFILSKCSTIMFVIMFISIKSVL